MLLLIDHEWAMTEKFKINLFHEIKRKSSIFLASCYDTSCQRDSIGLVANSLLQAEVMTLVRCKRLRFYLALIKFVEKTVFLFQK